MPHLQGDVMYLADSSGSQAAAYLYDPYGKVLTATGTMAEINPLRYRGYYQDSETGFYYLQSRYYDPAICRFINADSYASTGQELIGYNMFAYCGNSPINMSDLFGMIPKFVAELFEDSSLWVPTAAGLLRYVTEYTKKGELYEYWVNGDGHIVHSRHHSDHGNPKSHEVPHDHDWYDDDDGNNKPGKGHSPDSGFQAPSLDENSDCKKMSVKGTAQILISTIGTGYIIYAGIKWLVAIAGAPITGGGSLAIAGVMP